MGKKGGPASTRPRYTQVLHIFMFLSSICIYFPISAVCFSLFLSSFTFPLSFSSLPFLPAILYFTLTVDVSRWCLLHSLLFLYLISPLSWTVVWTTLPSSSSGSSPNLPHVFWLSNCQDVQKTIHQSSNHILTRLNAKWNTCSSNRNVDMNIIHQRPRPTLQTLASRKLRGIEKEDKGVILQQMLKNTGVRRR